MVLKAGQALMNFFHYIFDLIAYFSLNSELFFLGGFGEKIVSALSFFEKIFKVLAEAGLQC